jgi:hypothetical protein
MSNTLKHFFADKHKYYSYYLLKGDESVSAKSVSALFNDRDDLIGVHRVLLFLGGYGAWTRTGLNLLSLVILGSMGVLTAHHFGLLMPVAPYVYGLQVATLASICYVFSVYMYCLYQASQIQLAYPNSKEAIETLEFSADATTAVPRTPSHHSNKSYFRCTPS